MMVVQSLLGELNHALSYCYWSHLFTPGSGFDHNAEIVVREGYIWPSPALHWYRTLHGRRCPFCKGQKFFGVEPIVLEGVEIRIVHCLCDLLPYMDDDFLFNGKPIGSHWEPTDLTEYSAWGDAKVDAQQRKVLKGVEDFIRMPLMWRYLYGGFGSGKTMLLYAIKTQLRGLALYLNMYDLNNLVFYATDLHKLSDLIDVISGADILLLDDVGTEYPSPYFLSSLYGIINRRYAMREKAPTFFTSNLGFKQLHESPSVELKRIADRISDKNLTEVLVTTQPSWRQR